MNGMDSSTFDSEDALQKSFDNFKVDFKPTCVLAVTVLRCRKVSISYYWDKLFDTPDPQFVITCPKLAANHRFATVAKSNSPTCEINERFQFVIPDNLPGSFPVIISLQDEGLLFNDHIASSTIDAAPIGIGEIIDKTISFGKHGEVDIRMVKSKRISPDLRLAVGLHEEERAFRKKRFPIVYKALQAILGNDKAPKTIQETPVASLVCSGGGYRAVIGMCGAMEAIKDAGLMDAFTYAIGLSGSSWYLSSAYALKGMDPDNQAEFHEHLSQGMRDSFVTDFVNPVYIAQYRKYISKKEEYGQPSSFVDFFGYAIGKRLLGEKNMGICLSNLQPYVRNANVPFPLFASIHVRNRTAASKFHAYLDVSPFEVNLPKYALGVSARQYGSAFSDGIMARQCPELPLHFIQGMCGCAFSILLKVFIANGGEKSESFLQHMDEIRTRQLNFLPQSEVQQIQFDDTSDDDTSDDDDDDDDDDNDDVTDHGNVTNNYPDINNAAHDDLLQAKNNNVAGRCENGTKKHKSTENPHQALYGKVINNNNNNHPNKKQKNDSSSSGIADAKWKEATSTDNKNINSLVDPSYFRRLINGIKWIFGYANSDPGSQTSNPSSDVQETLSRDENKAETFFRKEVTSSSFFASRNAIIGRTAKVLNMAQGLEGLKAFCMNPFCDENYKAVSDFGDKKLLKELLKDRLKKMSTIKPVISVADAGVLKNVPTDLALRPQRTPDLLIVLDFNAYKSDESFDYMPLLSAATHACVQDLKFPIIDYSQVTKMPPTEFFRIEGNDDCPTVLWFTLCNIEFKKCKDFKPRHSKEFTSGSSYTDFKVFDEGNEYSTFKFNYTCEEFDRLRDLMYFNVSRHIDEIKDALAKAVERRRKREKV